MRVQCSIAGFSGLPITLLGSLNEKTGVLVVLKAVAYTEKRLAEDVAMISNADLPDCDYRFTDDDMRGAIRSYFGRASQDGIDIHDELARYRPDNRIERDGIDERGMKYRCSPDIDNGQIGVLALTAFAEGQRGVSAALDAMDDLSNFYGITRI